MGSKSRFNVDIMVMNNGVTGSCNLCVVNYPDGTKTKFLVDCGRYQGEDMQYNIGFDFLPSNIDFLLVTHNHSDHIGKIPDLVQNGYNKRIYATEITTILMPPALDDNFSIMSAKYKKLCKKAPYVEASVEIAKKLITPVEFYNELQLDRNIKATFIPNGHLTGACMIFIEISFPGMEPINIFFTGDYKKNNLLFDVGSIPEKIRKSRMCVIQESTYGLFTKADIHECFEENILQTYQNSGTAIVLAFSLVRTEEILYTIKLLQDLNKLSQSVPIFLDGNLAQKYIKLRLQNEELFNYCENIMPSNLTYVTKKNRMEVLTSKEAKIVVTSSGMGSYGPAQLYIPEYITRKNSLIQFSGYTAEGTLGRELKDTAEKESILIGGVLKKKVAKVDYSTEFSAHAKPDELIALLNELENTNCLLIGHGTSEAKFTYARKVEKSCKIQDICILNRDYFYRIGSYGLIKTINTKFI